MVSETLRWLPFTDFCDLGTRYPKVGMKRALTHYIEDYGMPIQVKDGLVPSLRKCRRGLWEGKHWFATLSSDQYSEGHSVIIANEHFNDFADQRLAKRPDVLADISLGIADCARRLRHALGAERIYVASLCDGVEHLHIHLIPRYHTDRKGFQFMGERERQFNEGLLHVAPRSPPALAEYLTAIARRTKGRSGDGW